MSYVNLFYIAICSMILLTTQPILQWINTSFYFGIKKLDDYISVLPGLFSPGYTCITQKKQNDLKPILKDMRTQIRFYSESTTEFAVTALQNPGYAFPDTFIDVTDIPVGSVIYNAALWWEGTVRNNRVFTNELITGEICLVAGTSSTSLTVNISPKFKIALFKCSKLRLLISNVLAVFQGNKKYTVRFQNLKSALSTLFFCGSWVLEVDFEMP